MRIHKLKRILFILILIIACIIGLFATSKVKADQTANAEVHKEMPSTEEVTGTNPDGDTQTEGDINTQEPNNNANTQEPNTNETGAEENNTQPEENTLPEGENTVPGEDTLPEEDKTEPEEDGEFRLESKKYLIVEEKGYISRIVPETTLEEFVQGFNCEQELIHVYEDESLQKEIEKDRWIKTGMVVTCDKIEEKYSLSVIGDMNRDGELTQIDLSLLIKHVIGLKGSQLKGLENVSADLSGDRKINQVDVTILIRYIMTHELYVPEIKRPAAPIIEVVEGTAGESTDWYVSDVTVMVKENEETEEKIAKTIYKMSGEKVIEETQIEGNEVLIELTEEGEYKITAWSYSEEGAKSQISSKKIKIDKTGPNLRVKTKRDKGKIEVEVDAEDGGSDVKEYTYYIGEEKEDGTVEWKEGITTQDPNHVFEDVEDDKNYHVKVEVKDTAGNTTTKENRTIGENDDNLKFTPETNGWTNKDVTIEVENENDKYTVQTSPDGENWQDSNEVTAEKNGKVYGRVTDGDNIGPQTEYEVKNIDKEPPKGKVEEVELTTKSMKLKAELTDNLSGIAEVEWHIKKKTGDSEEIVSKQTYHEIGTEEAGPLTVEVEGTFEDIEGGEYIVYVVVTDVAGNKGIIGKEGPIEPQDNEQNQDKPKNEEDIPTVKLPDVVSADGKLTLTQDTKKWTNDKVIVTASKVNEEEDPELSIQTSEDGKEWNDSVQRTLQKNGTVYARLYDGINGGEPISLEVGNIDKTSPTGTVKLIDTTTRSIDIEITAEDELSGIGKIKWYCVKDGETEGEELKVHRDEKEYTAIGEEDKGDLSKTDTNKLDELEYGTYKIYGVITDVAGNKSVIGKNGVLEGTTEEDAEKGEVPKGGENPGGGGEGPGGGGQGSGEGQGNEQGPGGGGTTGGEGSGNEQGPGGGGTTGGEEPGGKNKVEKVPLKEMPSAEGRIQLTPDNTNWTNGNVTVTASKIDGVEIDEVFKIQTSTNQKEWKNETVQTLSENGPVYARLWDGINGGQGISLTIQNIDKKLAKGTVSVDRVTTKSMEITVTAQDEESGIGQITWYYQKEEGGEVQTETNNYIEIQGDDAGDKNKTDKESFTNLKYGVYKVYAVVTDVAGNKSVIGKNGIIEGATEEDAKNGNVPKDGEGSGGQGPGGEDDDQVDHIKLKEVQAAEEAIQLTPDNTNWTNGNVKVTASKTEKAEEEFTIQTSEDATTWTDATERTIKEENKTVYARLYDGVNGGEETSLTVKNIDKTDPEGRVEITDITTRSMKINITSTDSLSGIGKVTWYCKENNKTKITKDIKNYKDIQGNEEGEKEEQETELVDNLKSGLYEVYAVVTDVAGNESVIGEDGVITGKDKNDAEDGNLEVNPTPLEKLPSGTESITLDQDVKHWTNGDVNVTAEKNSDVDKNLFLQTSTDGEHWDLTISEDSETFTENGTMYARLYDGLNVGEEASLTVKNIDKVDPTGNITVENKTTKSMDIKCCGNDDSSGISKIEWYYEKSDDSQKQGSAQENYATLQGNSPGDKTEEKTEKFDNLVNGTYKVYAIVTDVAGNTAKVSDAGVIADSASGTNVPLPTVPLAEGSLKFDTVNWDVTTHTANVKVNKIIAEDFKLQYRVTDGNGSQLQGWQEIADGAQVKNRNHGEIVQARLWDGVNAGDSASCNIIDGIAPTIEKVDVTKGVDNLTVTVTARDDQSGLATSETYKYYLGDSEKKKDTSNSYKFTSLSQYTNYSLKVIVKDKAGKETTQIVNTKTKCSGRTQSHTMGQQTCSSGYTSDCGNCDGRHSSYFTLMWRLRW